MDRSGSTEALRCPSCEEREGSVPDVFDSRAAPRYGMSRAERSSSHVALGALAALCGSRSTQVQQTAQRDAEEDRDQGQGPCQPQRTHQHVSESDRVGTGLGDVDDDGIGWNLHICYPGQASLVNASSARVRTATPVGPLGW